MGTSIVTAVTGIGSGLGLGFRVRVSVRVRVKVKVRVRVLITRKALYPLYFAYGAYKVYNDGANTRASLKCACIFTPM